MSTDLAVRESNAPAGTLDELAEIANEKHRAVEQAASEALMDAIAAGEALEKAHELVPHGEWNTWLARNFVGSIPTAHVYRRVAAYKHALAERNFESVNQAIRFLRCEGIGLPVKSTTKAKSGEIQSLRADGLSYKDIAERVGLSYRSVWSVLNPERHKKAIRESRRRGRAAEKALWREENTKAARTAGGGIAEAYSLTRRLAQALELAGQQADSAEARRALSLALHGTYHVEDQIARALRQKP